MNRQPEPTDRAEVTKLAAAVEEALAHALPTRFRDDTPLPVYGTTPPVAQPGIPPMSARATSNARVFMYCSWATLPPGLLAIGILVASEHANPTVIGMICAAPAAVAVPILAIARLLRRAGEATPTETHNHFSGPVRQEVHTDNRRAVWQKDVNRRR